MRFNGSMRFNGRIKHYRPSRYRPHKRPIDPRIVFFAGAAAVMFLFAVILGAWLNSRVDVSATDTDSADTESVVIPEGNKYDAYPKISTEPTAAQIIARSAYSSDTNLDKVIEKARSGGADSLCVELTNADGIPRFTSQIYSDVLSASSGKADLTRFVNKAGMGGISVKAQITLRSQSESEADLRALRLSLELSLIAEAYRAGVREILLSGIEECSLDEQYSIVRRIKENCPELAVGGVVSLNTKQANDVVYMAELDDIFDYIAIDLSEQLATDCADKNATIPEGEGALESAVKNYTYAFTRYNARAFMRAGDGCSHCTGYAAEALAREGVGGYYFITSDKKLHE